MKKSIGVFCVVLLLFGAVEMATADLQDGLVAYYPFCGNANDASGNSHDGDVQGPILTADRFGNADSAYFFDGVNDNIRLPASQDFALTSWTISGWLYMVDYPPNINSVPIITQPEDSNAKYNYKVAFIPTFYNSLSSAYESCESEFDYNVFYYGFPTGQGLFFARTRGRNYWAPIYSLSNGVEVDSEIWNGEDNEPCATPWMSSSAAD